METVQDAAEIHPRCSNSTEKLTGNREFCRKWTGDVLFCPRAYERMFRGADCLNQPQKEANEAKYDALRTPSHQDLHLASVTLIPQCSSGLPELYARPFWYVPISEAVEESRSRGVSGWQPIGWANGAKTGPLCGRAAEPQPRRGFISTTRLCPNVCLAKVTMRISL